MADQTQEQACSIVPFINAEDIPALKCLPDGRICVNPDKAAQKWFWFSVTQQGAAGAGFPVSIPTAGGTVQASLLVSGEENLRGDFEICALLATSTGRFAAEISQSTINRKFQNSPVPNNLLFGYSLFPGGLPETIYVAPTTSLDIRLTDLSGAPGNSISIVAIGRRFLDWGRERIGDMRRTAFYAKRTHVYTMVSDTGPQVPIANAGGTATILMTVPSNADFNALELVDDSDGDYTIQLFEGLSGRALMDRPLSARDFVAARTLDVPGTFPNGGFLPAAGLPLRICKWTHLWKRSSVIKAVVTDTSGAPGNNIRFGIRGQLIYYDEPRGEHLTISESESLCNQPKLVRPAPLATYTQSAYTATAAAEAAAAGNPAQNGMGRLPGRPQGQVVRRSAAPLPSGRRLVQRAYRENF